MRHGASIREMRSHHGAAPPPHRSFDAAPPPSSTASSRPHHHDAPAAGRRRSGASSASSGAGRRSGRTPSGSGRLDEGDELRVVVRVVRAALPRGARVRDVKAEVQRELWANGCSIQRIVLQEAALAAALRLTSRARRRADTRGGVWVSRAVWGARAGALRSQLRGVTPRRGAVPLADVGGLPDLHLIVAPPAAPAQRRRSAASAPTRSASTASSAGRAPAGGTVTGWVVPLKVDHDSKPLFAHRGTVQTGGAASRFVRAAARAVTHALPHLAAAYTLFLAMPPSPSPAPPARRCGTAGPADAGSDCGSEPPSPTAVPPPAPPPPPPPPGGSGVAPFGCALSPDPPGGGVRAWLFYQQQQQQCPIGAG
eukprot:gene35571-53660_t